VDIIPYHIRGQRRQKAEGRRQWAEGSGQKAEGRKQNGFHEFAPKSIRNPQLSSWSVFV